MLNLLDKKTIPSSIGSIIKNFMSKSLVKILGRNSPITNKIKPSIKPSCLVINKDKKKTWPKLNLGVNLYETYSIKVAKNKIIEKTKKFL
jgi:hypothetical protein